MKSFMFSHSRQFCNACSGVEGLMTFGAAFFYYSYSYVIPPLDWPSLSKSDRTLSGLLAATFNLSVRRGALPLFIMPLI